jgi:photosystem II stability/assembly factor-like uncharacterized protein
MSRRISWLIIVAIYISLLPIRMSSAQDGAWSESFDDPALPGWEHSPGAAVVDGVLRIEPGNFASRIGFWTDFTLAMRLRRIDGEGDLLMEYRATDAASNYLSIHGSGFALGRSEAGQSSELQRSPVGAPATDWFDLTLQVSGGQHSVLFNEQPILNLTEAGAPLPSGGVILHANGVTVEVDVMTMTIGAENPPPQAPPTQSAPPLTQTLTGEPGVWVRTGGPPGGLGYDIRMQPDNPDIMYVTDAYAGVHKSIDGGHTWFPANTGIDEMDMAGTIAIFSLTIDPHDFNTIWAGTQLAAHVYRSTDAGQTWEHRDSGIESNGRSVRGITIDPNDPNTIYAGVEVSSGAWNGTPIVRNYDLTQGEVYKSTDAGQSWVRIWTGNNLARYVWVYPRNSNRLYVSTGIFDRDAADSNSFEGIGGGVGIVRSDDDGQTWTVLNEANGLMGRYIPSLFMHPQNPDILIAATSYLSDEFGVWVTYNGGDTWQNTMHSDMSVEAVEIATSNPNVWYAAGENTIWRSDDAGQNWQRFRASTPDRDAGIPIDLQVDPRDPYRIFINNYNGGNIVSEDGGETWADASAGYTGLKVVGDVAVAPDDPNLIFANSFRSTDGGATWIGTDVKFGDSFVFYPLPDGNGYGVLAADTSGKVFHSTDHGATWQSGWIINLMDEVAAGRLQSDVLATTALILAPSDLNRGYAGLTNVNCDVGINELCASATFFRTDDMGYTWEAMAAPFSAVGVQGIAVHPDNRDLVFVGTPAGLYRSDDGAQSWQEVPGITIDFAHLTDADAQYAIKHAVVTCLLFDPFDSNVLYATVVPGAVWRSTDGGLTWQQSAGGMDPNEPLYEIIADSNRPGVLYASSDLSGVFLSTDGAQTWRRITDGLVNASVRGLSLSADGLTLYAGSIGGGVYRLDTSPFVNP